jgi:hypothetical protein
MSSCFLTVWKVLVHDPISIWRWEMGSCPLRSAPSWHLSCPSCPLLGKSQVRCFHRLGEEVRSEAIQTCGPGVSLSGSRESCERCMRSVSQSVCGGRLLVSTLRHPCPWVYLCSSFSSGFFFCSTGIWTQGIHLEPLHQPFFVMSFSKIRFCELFAQAGFRWPVLRSILSLLYQLQSHLLCSWTRSVSNKRQTCYYSHAAVASFHGSLALFWGS